MRYDVYISYIYIQYLFAHKVQSSKRCIQKISAAYIERDSERKKKKSEPFTHSYQYTM